MTAQEIEDRRLGPVTILFGEQGGKYPHGNSMLVEGTEETVLIDPSLSVIPRKPALPRVDRLLLSHCHEDHLAGCFLFPEVPWHVHEEDLSGLRSLDDFMQIYGFPEPFASTWRRAVVERFHFVPRPDALSFRDGDVFDLGGVRIQVVHTPGHTRGHSAFLVEPGGVLFLGDIDLSSFGPYYGEAWSDLESFERTLDRIREFEVEWYATFHHVGLIEERETFLKRLERFASVTRSREERLLAFLAEPRTLDQVAAHRFVYRAQDAIPYAAFIERRSMSQHIERLVRRGGVHEVAPGLFQARPA
jgi:glyoxylase-like metal-dependent hydrolase (beta-lactamase superfamily II)